MSDPMDDPELLRAVEANMTAAIQERCPLGHLCRLLGVRIVKKGGDSFDNARMSVGKLCVVGCDTLDQVDDVSLLSEAAELAIVGMGLGVGEVKVQLIEPAKNP